MQTRLDTRRSCMLYSVGSRHLRIRGTTYSSGITGDDESNWSWPRRTKDMVLTPLAFITNARSHRPLPPSDKVQHYLLCAWHSPWSLSVQFGTGQRAIRLFLLPCRTCGVAAPVGLPSQPYTCNLTNPVAAVEYSCCPFMTLQINIS